MFGYGMGRNALHSFTAKISLKHHESHQKKIPRSTLHQRIIPRKFRDGKTHNSYTKIYFSKFNFTKLYVYHSRENIKIPRKFRICQKLIKILHFFVVFARKINVFCYFCAVFVHSGNRQERKWREKQ